MHCFLTTNVTEDTVEKVMRFSTVREVWMELHRLFDGGSEDKGKNEDSQLEESVGAVEGLMASTVSLASDDDDHGWTCDKRTLSDNGGEFGSCTVGEILRENGIKQRLRMPYTPEQKGCSEREKRTLVETAHSIMHTHGNIHQVLWVEMVNMASYILNRTGPSSVDGKFPYELWLSKKLSIKNLRIISSTCYPHIPKQQRRKIDKKA
ncbi:hypothetical protein PR048_004740 [Dryococelus australis]|uniref:Integrase catalytic domain-containing protein n=1 Tax=Dryococelus australis TaxID=614101 RepID=A0ABQ9I6A3_9NEOP|nr:hypothetical protein PR048_004740 [Dryococelus australis]